VATGDLPRPTRRQRRRIDEVIARAEGHTGLQVCVFLGSAGEGDPRRNAEAIFVEAGLVARPAVLVLVDPPRHHVEVVTGPAARLRVSDEEAAAAVAAMTEAFRGGDLTGGLVAGIERLAAAAGPGRAPPGDEEIDNIIGG
jgi:uncharacterized membrane protein